MFDKATSLNQEQLKSLKAASSFFRELTRAVVEAGHFTALEAQAAKERKRNCDSDKQAELRAQLSLQDFTDMMQSCNYNETQEHEGKCSKGTDGSSLFLHSAAMQRVHTVKSWKDPLKCPFHRQSRNDKRRKQDEASRPSSSHSNDGAEEE
jgi:hypothetical protein